jgi:class 3 adenylate cyclase
MPCSIRKGLNGLCFSLLWFQRSAVFPDDVIRSFIELVKTNWPLAAQTFGDMSTRQADPTAGLRWGELNRESAPADAVERILQAGIERDEDIRGELANVAAPTLVMHRTGDLNIPLKIGQQVAAAIPNAVFVPVPGVISHPALGDQEPVFRAALPFLSAGGEAASPPSGGPAFRTVLFTDLVGHTEMMARLGDEKGREVLREHERITRDVLKTHAGTEIKTMGDGFMASFGSVTKAVECAVELQRAFGQWNADGAHGHAPLQVRVGLNAGEPIADEGDLFGATVILASRIAAQAGAGEILIPEPVRHLLAGKEFAFSDRGEFVPKGFDDAVRLFEVRWRE